MQLPIRLTLMALFAIQLNGCGPEVPTLPPRITPPSGSTPRGDDPFADDNRFALPDLFPGRISSDQMITGVWIPGTRAAAALTELGGICNIERIDADAQSHVVLAQDAKCSHLAVSPDGTMLYYLHDRYLPTDTITIRRLTIATGATVDAFDIRAESIGSLVLSPDGRRIAYTAFSYRAGGYSAELHLRDLVVGTDLVLTTLVGPDGEVANLAFSPDGTALVFENADRFHQITISTGVSQLLLGGLSGSRFKWTSTGVQYLAGGALTNASTGDRLGLRQNNGGLAWSADGERVAGWGFAAQCGGPWCSSPVARYEVTMSDWPTHQATVIARENCINYRGGVVVVSPDGNTVIYGLCSGILVWTRP